jgi:hypothetical protein
MNDREFSDTIILCVIHHRQNPVINIGCKPITTMGGVSSVLETERNNICVANVSDQSARKYMKIFPLKLKIKAVCTRFSDLVLMNIVSSQVRIAVFKCVSACFETRCP